MIDVTLEYVANIREEYGKLLIEGDTLFWNSYVPTTLVIAIHDSSYHGPFIYGPVMHIAIKQGIFDDYKTLKLIVTQPKKDNKNYEYHVRDNDITRFLYGIINKETVDKTLIAKNWPKIKSSRYGAQLHDISITCIND